MVVEELEIWLWQKNPSNARKRNWGVKNSGVILELVLLLRKAFWIGPAIMQEELSSHWQQIWWFY